MRFRLLRRRLTISAPRMAVRSALPWPLRWALAAIVAGFCAAIALWAFELGKEIAGLERDAKAELLQLRNEVGMLRAARDKAQSISNTAEGLLAAEKATQEALRGQVRQLQAENQALRDDLGFFQTLMPLATGADGLAIRGLQAELLGSGTQLKWQLLVVQSSKTSTEFQGRLEVTLAGQQSGKPWSMPVTGMPNVQVRQYRRLEGLVELPVQAVVKTVTVRLLEGNATRASQTISL